MLVRWSVVSVVVFLAACRPPAPPQGGPGPAPSGAPVESACLADRAGTEAPKAGKESAACEGGNLDACALDCKEGIGPACTHVGNLLEEKRQKPQANVVYARACVLGEPTGCSNYGAAIFAKEGDVRGSETCAVQLFDVACTAHDSWGCGMLGHAIATGRGVGRDVVRAAQLLGQTCSELGGFSCFVLGSEHEAGTLGAANRAAAKDAYARACTTGHTPACKEAERLRR